MSYETDEKSVVIFADAEDDNATVSINGNYESLSSLEVNKIEIEVTAEDDSKKTYTLNITKNQGISDTKLILKINDITVNFDDDNYYKTIELYYVDKVVFDYSLSNSDSTLKIYKNDEELTSSEDYIDVGDHKYKFIITDSNGDKCRCQPFLEHFFAKSS